MRAKLRMPSIVILFIILAEEQTNDEQDTSSKLH